jgi:tRNA (guanine-N7-)-methyltransferase
MGKDKLRRFADIRTYPNVYSSKNYTEALVVDYQEKEIDNRGNWHTHFGNKNPLILEVACGKGHYTRGLAQMHPDINTIGIDLKGNRIWKGATEALEHNEENVAFLRARVEFLERYFAPEEVEEIWITFPDPQYKKPKKRLTAPRFLDIYSKILKKDGIVHLKTDSHELYLYSLEVLTEQKVEIIYHSDDIYSGDLYCPELEIKTFYEEMHLAANKKITYIRFRL